MSTAARLGLAEAAERLGVHYQTAYRWVRQGVLPAVKVGGVYEVEGAALDELLHRRAQPQPPPTRRRIGDWSGRSGRALEALLRGDEGRVRELFEDLLEGGATMVELCDRILAPALVEIGERWSAGRLSIAEEHRASVICERALGRWSSTLPGRPRGVAVVCSPLDDEHTLPGHMAAAVLREQRWRVHHLGIGVPADAVVRLVDDEAADLVVISVTWSPALTTGSGLADALARPGRRVLLGRPGLTMADLVEALAEPG